MTDIVDLLIKEGYGVVEGKDAVLKKMDELSAKDFEKAYKQLKDSNIPTPVYIPIHHEK